MKNIHGVDLSKVKIGDNIFIDGSSEGCGNKQRRVIGIDLSKERSCIQVEDNGGKHWVFNKAIICNLGRFGETKKNGKRGLKSSLTQSEAIFAFSAWITTRGEVLKVGASENCSPIVELIKEFMEANCMEEPRDNYTQFFTMPD